MACFKKRYSNNKNKTRTSKVGAISKAQKVQNIFGKKLEIFENFSFGKCRTEPKNVKGGPFLIYKHAFCSKITKNSKGGPFGDIKKFSKKKSHSAEKIKRGDPLVSAGFVGYDKNGLTERGDPLQYLKCAASILVVL